MPRFIISDSGAVERTIKRLIIADSGGTSRVIKRMFVCDSGGTARLVFTLGVVTVSGQTIASSVSGGTATATVRFMADGTVEQEKNGVTSQIDSATDWIIPNSAASSEYQIRYINHSGSALTTSPASENAWVDLSVDRTFRLVRINFPGPGIASCTFTIQIRKGTGPVLDSATYTLSAQVT